MSEKSERENNFLNTFMPGKNKIAQEIAGILFFFIFYLFIYLFIYFC